MSKKTFLFLIVCSFFFSNLQAQGLEETLNKLSSIVGTAYVKPVTSAFGSNLNSGWVTSAPSASILSLYLDLKVVGMGSFFSDAAKTFSENGSFYFTQSQVDQILQNSNITPATAGQLNYTALQQKMVNTQFTVNFTGPTVIGKKNDYLRINFPGQTITSGTSSYTVNAYSVSLADVKGILDEFPAFPTAAVQLTVGTVFGTNFSFRYFPSLNIDNMGKLSFYGFGLIHNPFVWLPAPMPIDVGVGFFTQKMKIGDIVETSANQFGVFVSKTIGLVISITPYAGLTLESSKTTFKYNYQSNQLINGNPVPPVNVAFDIEGENSSAAVVGFTLHLAVINISADYKMSKTNTATAGISFGL